MGLFDLFRSENVDARMGYLRQLIRVAKADGHLDEKEYKFIQKVATRLETSDSELEKLKEDAGGNTGVGMQTAEERFQFVWDLVWVMTVDGDIDVNEVHICSRVAYNLGYPTEIVQHMAEHIQNHRDSNDSPEEMYRKAFNSFQSPDEA